MPTVAISGYITGIGNRVGTNGNYSIIDLLQFGNVDKRSEIVPILLYDVDLINSLYSTYTNGQIRDISMIVDIVKNKTDYMWICQKILHLGKLKQLEEDLKEPKEEEEEVEADVDVKEGEEVE